MKKLEKLSLKQMEQEMPVIGSEEQSGLIGGSGSCVDVNCSRIVYGADSTVTYFVAKAYDNGICIATMTGYFLEPRVDSSLATTENSDTAISEGTYVIQSSTYNGESGYYEVSNVHGRTNIKIHAGNYADDTSGCLLPGNNYTGDPNCPNDYAVENSGATLNSLTSFFNAYGTNGITMNIGCN